jgi:hypothetical protein
MHRTEGEDYILEGGKRRFAAANPPSQKATRLPAEFMNAVQEEICNVITAANPTIVLNAGAAADRTAGWGQLLKALQEGHLMKGTSFNTTALADGLKVGAGFVDMNNTRDAVLDLRNAFAYGFDDVFSFYSDPGPNSAKSKKIPFSVMAQAFGSEQVIVVSDPSSDTIDLALGGSYSEAWDSNLTIVITGGYTNTTLNIVAPTPRRARVTIVNAGWGPSADSESSYGTINWLQASMSYFALRKDYKAIMHFNDAGARIDIQQTPPHSVPYNGSPAFWSRLHGIRDMATVDVETNVVTPASGNPTWPYPLLNLAVIAGTSASGTGGGIRVAGNVGIEIGQATSDPGNSKYRKVSRIYFHQDGFLVWDKGQDANGFVLGKYDLNKGMVEQFTHYQIGLSNPTIGAWAGNLSTIADNFHFPFHFTTIKCATYQATICIRTDSTLAPGETISGTLELWHLSENNASSILQSVAFTITGVATNIGFYLASVDFTNFLIYPKTGIWYKVNITNRSGSTNIGPCDLSITSRFRQVAR